MDRTRWWVYLGGLVALLALFVLGWRIWFRPEIIIDPRAKIDVNQDYQLVLWDEIFPASPEIKEEQERAIRQAIREFQRVYPNVDVELKLWPQGQLLPALETAIADGRPPDVVMLSSAQRHPLQLPITKFAESLGEVEYFAPVWERMQFNGDYWAWPSWSEVRLLALNQRLLGRSFHDVLTAGDGSEGYRALCLDLTGLMERAAGVGTQPALVLQGGTGEALALILEGQGAPLLMEDGVVGWTQSVIADTAEQISLWFSRKVITTAAGDFLEKFYTGNSPIIGPVGPWVLGKIPKQRWSNTAPGANDIAFLPFPCQSTCGPPEPIDHRVAIFRQSPYKGAAHTRLAADFGRLYAKYMGIFYSVVRYGVPSYQPLLGIWSDQLKLSSLQQAGLLAACSGRARPRLTPEWEGLAKKLLDEAVLPEATAFLSGGISAQELAANLADEIERGVQSLRQQQEQKQRH